MARTLIIGLDGASLDLIEPWAAAGHLPNLAALMARGSYGPLRSVMPVLSSAAWASFMTGCNPGKHGIYDFVQRDLATYRRHVVHGGTGLAAPSLWRLLSTVGQRVGVVNVPMTYPVEPVNGVLVGGLGTPDYRPFTHPAALETELRAGGYRVNKRVHYQPGHEQAFLAEVYAITDLQAGAALRLLEREPWDFFMHVVRDPDEMAHFFWRHMDATHPRHDPAEGRRYGSALLDYYRHLDGWVGRFVAAVPPTTDILIVSDHGCGPLYKDVSLNEWLRQAGFLQIKAATAASPTLKTTLARLGLTRQRISRLLRGAGLGRVERWIKDRLGAHIAMLAESERRELSEVVDWAATQAYSFGYHGQIYLNLRGREAQGTVEPAEYDAVCAWIVAALHALVDPADGQPVVSAVYRKAELFHGPHQSWAPDLTVIMRDLGYITRQGYELAEGAAGLFATPHTHESGSHRELGVLIAAGPSYAARGRVAIPASLLDIAPTTLYLHGCPLPTAMDGVVLADWLAATINAPDVQYNAEPHSAGDDAAPAVWSAEDEAAMLKHLRNLGYVE